MSEETASAGVPKSFWWIGGAFLLWNIIGIGSYISSVTMSPEAIAALDAVERDYIMTTPAWVTGAFAIAVFGGTLGSVFLLMKKAWALPVFVISLVAVIVQFSHTIFMSELVQARGLTSLILPLLIFVIGVIEIWYSRSARQKGWLS